MTTAAVVLLALAAFAVYLRGWRALRAATGPDEASGRRLALFAGGLAVAAGALAGPLDALADGSLLVMHAVQLLLLTTIAPPLLVAGVPHGFVVARDGAPRAFVRPLANPLWCLLAFVTVVWVWHAPPLFDAAGGDAALRALQHASFLAVGVALAWPLVGPLPGLPRRLTGLRSSSISAPASWPSACSGCGWPGTRSSRTTATAPARGA
ncbi:Cytochrome c oxidase caa3-type, assembly factor CtaG-related protein [Conexibacter woesei DSM 14684]|uniref:Cytochrome c oxidase caa3-type, assembly factor CtaG-related protein n=1 Tax=Conexibacter woesei (strain DSM 14684 / CCUG 47730 / CIP 108061 / JCM 11494 / NBRC 100937 / ID131577) TaxID=469383 RepID=D3F7N9_CONWI|nr:Cytochrome c oxidase caa3-type, assembly factor CtaG-related protein [Conexibacter woesei DSM 14684]